MGGLQSADQLRGMTFEQADSFKYISSSPPFFRPFYVDPIILTPSARKGRQLTGLVHRKLSISIDTKGLFEIYKILLCLHLEYAAQVWNPHLKKIE